MGGLIPWICVAILSLAWQGAGMADEDHEQVYDLRLAGKILSLEQVLAISREQVAGKVIGVELERENGVLIYELEILDARNQVWEVEIDAVEGTILKIEED